MTRFKHLIAYALIFALIPALTWATRDGNGGYSLPVNGFSNPVTGQPLNASDAQAVWTDIETAIAGSVAADGQTTMSGNLKMGGNKITGLTTGSARTDSASLGQIQDGAMRWGGVAGGTADALTLSLTPAITGYVDGLTVYFVASASPNTGAATVNVNSVATDAILRNGSALVAGDIAASKLYAITYYNSDWHLWSPLAFTNLLNASNTFTATQTVAVSSTGTVLTLRAAEDSASGGPDLLLDRNSASPAVSDVIGNVVFQGRDSGGNSTSFGRMRGVITDPTDGSEDGQFVIVAPVAGAQTNVVSLGGGVQVGTPTGGDKGVGALNAAAGVYIAGHGTIAQVVRDTETAYSTAGTQLPVDNSIPQNTEGDEILSVAITPVNASSTIRIRSNINFGVGSTSLQVGAAAFVDTTADALCAVAQIGGAVTNMSQMTLECTLSAGSTSARTYKIRVGSSSATDMYVNGNNANRIFGGVAVSTLEVEEILPQ